MTTAPTDPQRRGRNAGRAPGRHLVLVGPTASGKSAVAMALAERRLAEGDRVEIVSMDSMQVYRGMDIGTAKPTAAEQARVPHHLIDLVEPTEEHSVAEFARAAAAALDDIEARGARALLVGGTGLYVQAIVDDLQLPGRYPEHRARLEAEADTDALYEQLGELDPVAASRIERGNRRRIVRALEVTLGSSRRFSEWGPGLEAYPPSPFVLVGLHVDRDRLRRSIEQRYREQIAAGFLDEVRRLVTGTTLSRTSSQALGYRELIEHLEGTCTLDEAIDHAVTRTRQFAVRQIRWFRRDPRIDWVDHVEMIGPTVERIDRQWRKHVEAGIGSTATVGRGPAVATEPDPTPT